MSAYTIILRNNATDRTLAMVPCTNEDDARRALASVALEAARILRAAGADDSAEAAHAHHMALRRALPLDDGEIIERIGASNLEMICRAGSREPATPAVPAVPAVPADTFAASVDALWDTNPSQINVNRLRTALEAYVREHYGASLTLDHTGGGCDCWAATLRGELGTNCVSMMVTHAEDPSAPEFDYEPVMIGLYLDDENGVSVLTRFATFETVGEAACAVERGFLGVDWTEEQV